MVARGSTAIDVQASDPGLLAGYPDPALLTGIRGFPDRNLAAMQAYAQSLADLATADAAFTLNLMHEREWDFFFVYFSTLDAIGHFFWNYFDPEDPHYSPDHPLRSVIPDTYKLYDGILGRFLAAIPEDVTLVLLSDHGHGARPFKLVSVNEVLRQGGFLKGRDLKKAPQARAMESAKRLAVQVISRYGLGRLAGRVMRRFPGTVQTFTRPVSVDWEHTVAYASDMSGVKAYPYGGIMINRAALGGRDYETVRSEIIELLQKACVLPDSTPLVEFIARREDVYAGPYIGNYPDIVLEFIYGYGLGWSLWSPLITQAASYNLVPGSHRGATGTCLLRTPLPIAGDTIDLLDITPTLLDMMAVPAPEPYGGKSVLSAPPSAVDRDDSYVAHLSSPAQELQQ